MVDRSLFGQYNYDTETTERAMKIDPSLNLLEVINVVAHLGEQGIEDFTLRPGNDCIWATYRRVSAYYIFKEGYLVDVVYD